MKFLFTVFILASFVILAVFGFFAMGEHAYGHGACVASMAQGSDCPQKEGPLEFISFHLSAFKSFSNAVSIAVSMLAALTIFVLALWGVFKLPTIPTLRNAMAVEEQSLGSRRDFIRWLARHENSPNRF